MIALPLPIKKLWLKISFFLRRPNFKVNVTRLKIMVCGERSCHKGCTSGICKPFISPLSSYDQGPSFWKVGQASRSRSLCQTLCYVVKSFVTRNAHVTFILIQKLWTRLKRQHRLDDTYSPGNRPGEVKNDCFKGHMQRKIS